MRSRAGENAALAPEVDLAADLDADLAADHGLDRGPVFYSVPVPQITLVPPAPTAPTSRWNVSAGKRCMDVILSAIALLLLSPVFVVVGLLVARSSAGPILFVQRRVGRFGQLFPIYKFRTMHCAPQHRGPAVTQCGDVRITPIGKWLRRYKLDELPQFYNVLRGDMSLVGPRPKLAQHEGMHMPFRPGITGAATLAFRCEEQMLRHVPHGDLDLLYSRMIKPMKTRLDSEYMESATLGSDLSLLVKTAAACLLPARWKEAFGVERPELHSLDLQSLDILESLDM
ncbi:MAG TPA: sugar transferase [Acidisarcina sp.]